MEVTRQLVDPNLDPCPERDDLPQLLDDQCRPIKCTRHPDWTGQDCCLFWKNKPNVWGTDVVRVDQINPERFKLDQYRYQVFAKPFNIKPDHYSGAKEYPDKYYVPPTTDVRSLNQTMYVPVLPHRPGGTTEYTFPMTPQTMGEPDVTTACCVPVMPCNPGFQNMTSGVRADPNYMCQTYNKCDKPMQIGPEKVSLGTSFNKAQCVSNQHAMGGHVSHFSHNYAGIYPPPLNAPHFLENPNTSCTGPTAFSIGLDVVDDGVNLKPGPGAAFTSIKSLRYRDRVDRAVQATTETQEERARRLKCMYGAFGSYLIPNTNTKRNLVGVKDTINLQGNGFCWNYPKNENHLCYIIERNPRC